MGVDVTYCELLDVLNKINNSREAKVPEDVLEEVLAIVIRNPLPEDRGRCQDQIKLILSQRLGVIE